MIVKTEVVSTDEFEEIDEFEMPLETNGWMKLDISRELDLLHMNKERNYEDLG
jgi:hypothetical protein